MAVLSVGSAFALDFRTINVIDLLLGDMTIHTATKVRIEYDDGLVDEFTGTGFTYNVFGEPIGGTITEYRAFENGVLGAQATGLNASAVTFMTFVKNSDNVGAVFFLLAGNDQISGGALADFVAGGNGNDTFQTFGGDDWIAGNAGNDTIDGGGGVDTASFLATYANISLTKTGSGWTVTDRTGEFGTDTLTNVERLEISGRTLDLTLSNAATATATSNILRTGNHASAMLVANGAVTSSAAVGEMIVEARQTTSVATLAYQFFTGKIPGLGGIDYLVSPTGPNPNNLNSAYYQTFNVENRYINFSVNLGKEGEGKAAFLAAYGSLTLAEATKKAYGTIFGNTPNDAKVAALLADGRDLYFASYGGDGPNGQGTKAAMVGWLLAEAVKADLGMYAKANDAFLMDLADGATFAVDLVGVYGKSEFNFG